MLSTLSGSAVCPTAALLVSAVVVTLSRHQNLGHASEDESEELSLSEDCGRGHELGVFGRLRRLRLRLKFASGSPFTPEVSCSIRTDGSSAALGSLLSGTRSAFSSATASGGTPSGSSSCLCCSFLLSTSTSCWFFCSFGTDGGTSPVLGGSATSRVGLGTSGSSILGCSASLGTAARCSALDGSVSTDFDLPSTTSPSLSSMISSCTSSVTSRAPSRRTRFAGRASSGSAASRDDGSG
ncbi:hypothetical protein KC345_g161 [Hortaea werneckii]|nr:hypothetical protein KC345_g161 [Hortaea werneckii]